MRVTTGTARGRKLLTLEGVKVRPTTGRVKEAVFSAIQFEIEGRKFLDLFAGSGQMGIEALSRGAKSAVFVDASPESINTIKKNIQSCGFEKKATVINSEYANFLRLRHEFFDIAYLDPPFGENILGSAIDLLSEKISDSGVIICESLKEDELPENAGKFAISKRYQYGKTVITMYRNKNL